jgi:hypothetical protein
MKRLTTYEAIKRSCSDCTLGVWIKWNGTTTAKRVVDVQMNDQRIMVRHAMTKSFHAIREMDEIYSLPL